jgi:hypothetical protein
MTQAQKSALAQKFGVVDPPQFTDADAEAVNSGPAIFSNKMFATVAPQGLRLTFAETNIATQLPQFRAAVFLSFPDAAALMDLLERQLGLVDSVINQSEKP